MLGKRFSAIGAVALICAPSLAPAATFDVNNPAEFQAALTAAASNGENDVINVGVSSVAESLPGVGSSSLATTTARATTRVSSSR